MPGEVRKRWLTTLERPFFRATQALGEHHPYSSNKHQRRLGSEHVKVQENLTVRDIDIRNFIQLRNLFMYSKLNSIKIN